MDIVIGSLRRQVRREGYFEITFMIPYSLQIQSVIKLGAIWYNLMDVLVSVQNVEILSFGRYV